MPELSLYILDILSLFNQKDSVKVAQEDIRMPYSMTARMKQRTYQGMSG